MSWRTDGAARAAEDGGMKTPAATFPELFARWKNASWPLLTGRPGPSSDLPKAVWEGEGGAIKPPKTPA